MAVDAPEPTEAELPTEEKRPDTMEVAASPDGEGQEQPDKLPADIRERLDSLVTIDANEDPEGHFDQYTDAVNQIAEDYIAQSLGGMDQFEELIKQ